MARHPQLCVLVFDHTVSWRRKLMSPSSFYQAWDWHCPSTNSGWVPHHIHRNTQHLIKENFLTNETIMYLFQMLCSRKRSSVYGSIDGVLYEWMNEWMNERMSEWMNEYDRYRNTSISRLYRQLNTYLISKSRHFQSCLVLPSNQILEHHGNGTGYRTGKKHRVVSWRAGFRQDRSDQRKSIVGRNHWGTPAR